MNNGGFIMIGNNLKRLRKEKKMSLRALSEKADVSKSTLSDIENESVKSTTITTLEKIADALDVSVGYLIGESTNYIIDKQLEELGLTYEELAQQTGLTIEYLKNLGNIMPDPYDYQQAQLISRTLQINPENLISALAKQEPPVYEGGTHNEMHNTLDDFPYMPFTKNQLSDDDVFTFAAKIVGYDKDLTDSDIEKMKVALKIALNT
jgi:transcriptional regulator with XRE-family HTH domain